MPRYTKGQLLALAALYGGDVSKAAEAISIDEDYLQSAIDGRKLPDSVQIEIQRKLEDYSLENEDDKQTMDRLSDLLDNWYPQLQEIFFNDSVAETMAENPKFIDIFYRDATVWKSNTPLRDKETGEIKRYVEGSRYGTPGEIIYKRYSHGGLYPGAIDVIVDWAKNTRKGTPRKKGQADLSPMIEALEEDGYEIGDIDESAFWKFFRSIYPE